jgi:uncharacterized membrane protein YfcA
VRVTSRKVFIIASYTLLSLVIFALDGQIDWGAGIVLAVSEGTGGWVASRLAVDRGERLVRGVLILMILVVALRYLQIIPGL